MRFALLGQLTVSTDDGRPVRIPEAKVRALLAVLLLHRGEPVPVARLLDELWGAQLPGNPANTLHTKVSLLRRALEDAQPGGRRLVVREAGGYALRVEPGAVDADRFRSLVDGARASADPRARAALYTDALALWRGSALAEFTDEPFAEVAARRLEQERLVAVEEQVEARLLLGQHRELTAALSQLVAHPPLRERLRGAYARALYGAGRASEALDTLAELRRRLAREQGLDLGPELVALRQAMLTQDPALIQDPALTEDPALGVAEVVRARGNLPAPLIELVGRAEAVRRTGDALVGGRLVTLTGPGGVGKTALAVHAARRLFDRFPDGVWLVELAEVGAGDGAVAVEQAVVAALGIRESAPGTRADPAGRVVDFLADKRALLVLDNCEHVVTASAELSARLLGGAEGVRILATSREALGIAGEVLIEVPPLELPPELPSEVAASDSVASEVVAGSSAVRLFAARSAAAAPGFAVDGRNVATVAAICARLDGIPLALELAAARVRVLGPAELLARLDDRFGLLTTGHRDAPARQRTLRGMIDWSWRLLGPTEQAVLRRLAVHRGGCTLEAAERVCAGAGVAAGEVLDALTRLVDRSLVVAVADPATGALRYRLLESIAAYCLDRLREGGELASVRQAHLVHYLELAERADARLRGPDQRDWLGRLDAERANLRRAGRTAAQLGHAELACRLVNAQGWYWFLRGQLVEAERAITSALAVVAGGPPDAVERGTRARAATWRAALGLLGGDPSGHGDPAGHGDAEPWRDIADPLERAHARWLLANVRFNLGQTAAEHAVVDELLAEFRAAGDRWGIAAALTDRAHREIARGGLDAAERDASLGAELFDALGDRWGQLQASFALGQLAEIAGDYDRCGRIHRTSLRLAEDLELWPEVSYQLSWLGRAALLTGDHQAARDLHEQAGRLAEEHGSQLGAVHAETGLALLARRQGRFDDAHRHLSNVRSRYGRMTDEPGNALILAELGFVAEQRGDPAGALALHLEGWHLVKVLGDPRAVALALEGLAGAEALAGRHDRAALLLGTSAAVRDAVGAPLPKAERGDVDRIEVAVLAALGEAGLVAGLTRGRRLDPERAVGLLID